jgi:hypothetical protein
MGEMRNAYSLLVGKLILKCLKNMLGLDYSGSG